MADRPRATISWLLVASSALLLALVLYLLFVAYLPAKKRIVQLEAELRDLYTREAQLQTRMARETDRAGECRAATVLVEGHARERDPSSERRLL